MSGRGDPVAPRAARLRRTGAALWRQLLDDLRDRLSAGEFAERFPGELELTEQYGVSRHTVREALRQLRGEGVLTVTPGRRTLVAPTGEPVIEQRSGTVYSLFSAVETSGREQISVVGAQDVRADGVIAARLGLEESTPLFHLERLRLADGEPLALDRVWLPAAVGEPLLEVNFDHAGLYDQLLATTGIAVTGGSETVRAVIPSPAEHRTLHLMAPAAAFFVQRTGTSHGVPIEWRQMLIRADRFTLTSRLVPESAMVGADTAPVGDRALAVTPAHRGTHQRRPR